MNVEQAEKEKHARSDMMGVSLTQPYRQSMDIDEQIEQIDKVENANSGKTNGVRRSRRLQGLAPDSENP